MKAKYQAIKILALAVDCLRDDEKADIAVGVIVDMLTEFESKKEDKQEINFPQIFFAIKWICENINTEKVDPDDIKEIKNLADQCHVAYLKET